MDRVTIHCDYGCPYAHRLEALLTHLRVDYDVEHTHEGPIPRIAAGDLKLYETSVITSFLVESLDWREALPSAPAERAAHRLAIRQIENVWSAGLDDMKGALSDRARVRLELELDDLAALCEHTPSAPCLLAFAAVPFWIRWRWLDFDPMLARIASRPELHAWLVRGETLPAVVTTTPDKERAIAEAKRVVAA